MTLVLRIAVLAVSGCALAGSACAGAARAAEPDTYLFDVLRHAQYKLALKKLLKDRPVPDWVSAVITSGEGVTVPARSVEIVKKTYRLDHVCKVHDCSGNVLVVLWSAGGQRVWAALREGGGAPVFFGTPSPDQTEVLLAAAKS